MKPLILILAVAISAEAQSLADAARQERARQAQHKSTRVFSDVNAHVVKSAAPAETPAASGAKPKTAAAPAGAAAPTGTTAAAMAATAAAVDPFAEEMQKLRIRVRALEDQETSLKIQIVETTNQVYAPLTDQASHNDALTRLGEVQVKLADVQKTLSQTRSDLQQMEIQASAKK
jgi:hypothetical protein